MLPQQLRSKFARKTRGLERGPSTDFFLPLIGDFLSSEEDIDYFLVAYQILSKIDRRNGRFLLKYIRACLDKGYKIQLFCHTAWLVYIGDTEKLFSIFSDKKNYDFFFRYYIGLLLDMTKK